MATVQLAETPEESVAALRDLQKSAAELVKKTESRVKFAPNGLADALQAQAILLEVRIELLKVEAKIKPRKK